MFDPHPANTPPFFVRPSPDAAADHRAALAREIAAVQARLKALPPRSLYRRGWEVKLIRLTAEYLRMGGV